MPALGDKAPADAKALYDDPQLAPGIHSAEDLEQLRERVGNALSAMNGAVR